MGWDNSLWQTVLSTALIGTERQPFTVPTPPGKVGQLLSHLSRLSSEAALLTTAAMLALHHQAGTIPKLYPVSTQAPCDRPDAPRCSYRVTRFLPQMLQGQYAPVLPEWLARVAQMGWRVPELYLPDLLDLGRQQRELRAAILPVLGQRGRWLAAQNPDWSYAVDVASEADWETGSSAARLLYLQEVRLHHPDRARDLLQTTWKQEAAGDRAKFLETLRPGLSMADEPFLEATLGDRSKDVRRIAADLLASLPDSRLCQRMVKRLESFVIYKEAANHLDAFDIALPATCDAAMQQDGIELKPRSSLGERAWWLQQMISAAPLSFWEQPSSVTIADLIKIAQKNEWKDVLIKGWQLAAQRQGDRPWAELLLQNLRNLSSADLQQLLDVLTAEQREEFALRLIQAEGNSIKDPYIWAVLLDIAHHREPWGNELAHLVLDNIGQQSSQETINQYQQVNQYWQLRELLKVLPLCIAPDLGAEMTDLLSSVNRSPLADAISQFRSMLQFRQDLHQALSSGDSL